MIGHAQADTMRSEMLPTTTESTIRPSRSRRCRRASILGLVLCAASGLLLAQESERVVPRVEPTPGPAIGTGGQPIEAPSPPARSLSGTLRLVGEDGQVLTDEIDLSDAVVYFNPDRPVPVEPAGEEVLLSTSRRQFVPRVVVVEAGSVVRFPNEDPILHNVFSSSPGNRFDLGLYGRSEGLTHRFDEPGLVRVFCNVHSRMSAHIVVVDTPFHTRPDSEGRFRFDALPPGPGRLTAWHERSDPVQIPLEIGPSDLRLDTIELQATVRQIAPQRERLRRRRY
jgi:plastocyanin